MTDDEILDEWHAAKSAHASAPDDEKDKALKRLYETEAAAVSQIGLGKHMKAYDARFPED